MQKFSMADFCSRSVGSVFSETELAKVLAYLPPTSDAGPWLAGGSLRRTLMKQSLESDFDFFFANEDQLKKFTADLENRGLTKKKETEHHEQWEGYCTATEKQIVVQAIRFQYYKDAQEVIGSFDFTVCMFAYDGDHVYCGDFSLWDLGRKRLAVNVISFPLSSMRRLLKYTRQGFMACDGCLAALATAISDNPSLAEAMNIKYVD